jgi:hypothetical protein
MTPGHFDKVKSRHAAWLLAVVLFFSGLSFSSPVAYARERQTKARTELVLSARKQSILSSSPYAFPPPTVAIQFIESSHAVRSHAILTAMRIREMNKIHRQFLSTIICASFFSQQSTTDLPRF